MSRPRMDPGEVARVRIKSCARQARDLIGEAADCLHWLPEADRRNTATYVSMAQRAVQALVNHAEQEHEQ